MLLLKKTKTAKLDTVSFGFSTTYNVNGVTYNMSERLINILTKRLPYDFLDGIDNIIKELLKKED